MRRNRTSQDSLELFLDTICNMFGGFIFIMLFVVVSIRSATDSERQQMKESGITPVSDVEVETLNVEIEKLKAELENVRKNETDNRKFVEDLIDPTVLEKYRETLEVLDQIEKERETKEELVDANEAKTKELDAVDAERERLEEELKEAQAKLEDAETDVKEARAKRVRKTTPPRQHDTDKIEVPVVIKYGKCYFWHVYGSQGERVADFNDDFTIVKRDFNGAQKVEPKPWRGIDLNGPDVDLELTDAFRKFNPGMFYIAIVLANDSYTEYNVLTSFLKKKNYEIYPVGNPQGERIYDRGGYGHKTQ